ncbi:MAG: hypothetical protein ABIE23_02145 [archaeon]
MRKVTYYKVGGKDVHLPRLIGAFVFFGALIMVLQSAALMFYAWDSMLAFPSCVSDTTGDDQIDQLRYMDCKDSLYKSTGVAVAGGEGKINARQFFAGAVTPIAALFFWAIIFVFGIIIYKTGDLVIPIEESVREIKETVKKETKKK